MRDDDKLEDSIIKILAVVGAVVVLSFSGFITMTVLTNLPDIFSNITAQAVNITQTFIPNERIVVTLSDETPGGGDTVKLSFEHLSKGSDGSYSFFYECRDGVHFERAGTNGEVIFCNTPYNFINSDNSFSLVVFSIKPEAIKVPLSINFVKNNSTRISKRGEATLKINKGSGTTDDGAILIIGNSGDTAETTPRSSGANIYLNQAPYIGFAMNAKGYLLVLILSLWIVAAAYFIIRRRNGGSIFLTDAETEVDPYDRSFVQDARAVSISEVIEEKEHTPVQSYTETESNLDASDITRSFKKASFNGNDLPVEDSFEEEIQEQAKPETEKSLEMHAKEGGVLVSSDALDLLDISSSLQNREKIDILNSVIAIARTTFPREDGWVILDKKRLEAIIICFKP